MNIPVQVINPVTYPGWDEVLLSTPGCSFFHSSSWARVLSESYGFTPTYFSVIDHGQIHALVPFMEVSSILTGKRGVSLPFTDYCEPIRNNDVIFQDVLQFVTEYGKRKGWNYIELRGCQEELPAMPTSVTYLRHTVDLTDNPEEIFRTFRKGTKSAISKAEKQGVEIMIGDSEKAAHEFYQLNCITRKYHGLPPQPKSFFRMIYHYVIKAGLGRVVLASYRGEIIAGAVFFHFGNQAIYKYGASKRAYQDLRANNLILWNSIVHYSREGCESLCLGRTETEHEGLRSFKKGWGAREGMLGYHRYDLRLNQFVSNGEKVSKVQNKVFEKMPIPLLKIIGAISYKHVG
jgi:hypothetical protein